jgi:hypothetical protein
MLGNLVKLRARVPMYELLSKHLYDLDDSPVAAEPAEPA